MSHHSSSVNGEGTSHKDSLSRILDELSSLKLWKEKQERKEKGKKLKSMCITDLIELLELAIVVNSKILVSTCSNVIIEVLLKSLIVILFDLLTSEQSFVSICCLDGSSSLLLVRCLMFICTKFGKILRVRKNH